ncbi:MAG: hypothetical protein QOG04_1907 [Actinomycetota bacterium]|jgi:hypothetical protein|nr:hypothetical protein [Actinomycetota bacterium]
MTRRLICLVLALAAISTIASSASAETVTYDTFTGSTRFQMCYQIDAGAFGSACSWPTDATFERQQTAEADGTFVNSVSSTGGNLVTATKGQGTATETFTLVLTEPVKNIDMTFVYRLDELSIEGSSDCGLIMSANTGCTFAEGGTQLEVTPPTGGHICADGTDSTAGYPFGFTHFGTDVKRANQPGRYTGGFFMKCHAAAISAGSTVKLTFQTSTQVSATGTPVTATVAGKLLAVSLER